MNSWPIRFALVISLISLSPPAFSREEREISVFVDPRLTYFDLPASPTEDERIGILQVLDAVPVICRVGTDPEDITPPAKAIESGLSRLALRADVVESLANIILTERTLSQRAARMAIDFLVYRQSAEADRWLIEIYQAAPIIGERFIDETIRNEDLEAVRRSKAISIRDAVTDGIDRWQNGRLRLELRRELAP